MQEFTLREAVAATGGRYVGPDALLTATISDVVIDSRSAGPGMLFVPIKGERFDGHRFIPAAMEAGALCTLSEHAVDAPHILVDDTLLAFQALAAFYLTRLSCRKIGITGSVGKTTTKELVASALSRCLNTLSTAGNLNNQTGVPLTVFRLNASHEAAVIEMGTNHFGEIDALSRIVKPDICLLTNIGMAHIEHFGTREGILQGKTEMLAHIAPGGRVIVNGDDALLLTLKRDRGDVTTYGIGTHNDVFASDIEELGLEGLRFLAHYPGGSVAISLHAPGLYMAQNALAALAVGLSLRLPADALAQGIADYTPLAGRMKIEQGNGVTVLNDAYNASPTAMRASLDVLRRAQGRKVALLGDMLELGEEAPRYHREVGAYAKEAGISLLLSVGPLSTAMAEGYLTAGGARALHYPALEPLLTALPELLQAGDTVLVKASHSMGLSRAVPVLLGQGAGEK